MYDLLRKTHKLITLLYIHIYIYIYIIIYNISISKFNKFGEGKIEFEEMAEDIWVKNKFDVIVEPAGIYWTFMVDLWPKAKFIQVTRDEEAWKNSFM